PGLIFRLKIGAKSKKDPHIRVGGGQEDGVKAAKARITEVLDTRVNSRVTMKMDVSYTDHSHIIGKGGNTIRRVMSDTNCHIHFPDSNRSNPNEKSNQVSIAGEMAGVERARARVRELTPLIFQFDLAIVPSFHSIPDPNNQYLRAIQDQYNIQISFRQKQKNFHTTTVVIKGCELEASRVKEATLLLMDQLSPNNPASVSVNMTMEISPGHHNVVVGKESINLRVIMQRTNTTIIFPDAGDPNIPPIRKGSVTISGAIHNVYLARQLLLGSLPIVMMFDLPENIEIHESMVQKLQEANEVTITIKPKARQTNKSVIIKSQERNVGGMYVARHKLLDLEGEEVKADVPETYKVPLVGSSSMFHLASLPANRGPFLCATPQLQALSSPLSPNFIHPSCYTPVTPNFPPVSPWQFPTNNLPPVTPDMGKVAPTFPSLQEYMMIMGLKQQQQQQQQLLHQQQLHQQQLLEKEQLELEKKQRSAWTSPPQRSNRMGPSSSDLGSSMHSSPIHSPRNSSPVNPGGNLTNNLHKMELTSSSSSGIVTDHNVSDLSAIMADFPDLSCTDRRAPGCEKKVAEIADYEHARIIAHQAIQQKPGGEERKPNPSWAGFGFSASFPDAVLRERRQTENRLRQRPDVSHMEWIHNMAQIKEGEDIDLEQLLLSQGLSKYSDVFLRHEIDLKMFSYLTEDELKEIGINAFGPRKKLLMLGEKIRGKTLTGN
ncbi:protein bicaudal C homolog 1-A, partial [Eurytemora carolleeae]|uniref:protein bicaudal C homolog 1-A n=1 Tax=Eurytemora carolleeae TaxID=1294199 RepID=UPI000C768310